MKCINPRHKTKLKQKSKQVENKTDPTLEEFMFVIQTYKEQIQKLIFKRYSSLSELENIKKLLYVYYSKNDHFKNYCKLNQISYHFLNRELSSVSKINW